MSKIYVLSLAKLYYQDRHGRKHSAKISMFYYRKNSDQKYRQNTILEDEGFLTFTNI